MGCFYDYELQKIISRNFKIKTEEALRKKTETPAVRLLQSFREERMVALGGMGAFMEMSSGQNLNTFRSRANKNSCWIQCEYEREVWFEHLEEGSCPPPKQGELQGEQFREGKPGTLFWTSKV